MNRQKVITTQTGHDDALLKFYQFPPSEGYFIGTLTHRAWHHNSKHSCLVCYFDTYNGERFKLMAWRIIFAEKERYMFCQ